MGTTLTLQGIPCFSCPSSPFLWQKWPSSPCCLSKRQTALRESCEPALDDGNLPSFSRLSVLGNFFPPPPPAPRVMEKIAEAASEPLSVNPGELRKFHRLGKVLVQFKCQKRVENGT